MNNQNVVRLPLKNAYNVRELGGYPNHNGQVTKQRTLLRADDLYNLDENDINYLLNYGVTAIVDLRSASELANYPNPFSRRNEVNYINLPLMANDVEAMDITQFLTGNPKELLPHFYVQMVKESTEAIKNIFEFIADQEGCVLYHCAAGKDRTGIISMLLLGTVDVSKSDIIANYMQTEVYIKENPLMQRGAEKFPVELMHSKPEYIEPVLDYIMSTYGNVENYLKHIGINNEVISNIKHRMLSGSLVSQ